MVTCNYPARAAGITKLMSVKDAKNKCPSLVLVSGEDLTPYRRASRAIMAVLERFGTAQRLGMDEVFVDITAEVAARISRGTATSSFVGHVHDGSQASLLKLELHLHLPTLISVPCLLQQRVIRHLCIAIHIDMLAQVL